MPAIAPNGVSRRHQIPSSSNGQNDDAATANASPTTSASDMPDTSSAAPNGTTAARQVATRKPRSPRSNNTSCDSTPATDSVSPDDVDRNAANAPPATRALSSSPR